MQSVWSLKLLLTHAKQARTREPLLQPDVLAAAELQLTRMFDQPWLHRALEHYVTKRSLPDATQLVSGSDSTLSAQQLQALLVTKRQYQCAEICLCCLQSGYLVWLDFPSPDAVHAGIARVKQLLSASQRGKKSGKQAASVLPSLQDKESRPKLMPLLALAWPGLTSRCLTAVIAASETLL